LKNKEATYSTVGANTGFFLVLFCARELGIVVDNALEQIETIQQDGFKVRGFKTMGHEIIRSFRSCGLVHPYSIFPVRHLSLVPGPHSVTDTTVS
jgi:hypothetical protein